MPRVRFPPSEGVLVSVVILGVVALAAVLAGATAAVATDRTPETSPTVTENESTVRIDVDCNRSSVDVALPEEHQYDVTVGVANLTPTSNSVSRSTFGPVTGSTTVEVEDEGGIVFTIVQNRSEDGEIAATNVTNCGDSGEPTAETESRTEVEPTISVDCENGSVRFDAAERTEYVAKVTVVELSATGTSTSSSTRTFEGNATVAIEEDGLVAAFASTGELGDVRTASAVQNCSSVGTNSTDEPETPST